MIVRLGTEFFVCGAGFDSFREARASIIARDEQVVCECEDAQQKVVA